MLQKPLTHVALAGAVDDESVRWQWTFMVAGLRHWLQRCPAADGDSATRGVGQTLSAYNLVDLLFTDADWFNPSEQTIRVEAAASLIAYLVHTYGEERLPGLLDAFAGTATGRRSRQRCLAYRQRKLNGAGGSISAVSLRWMQRSPLREGKGKRRRGVCCPCLHAD